MKALALIFDGFEELEATAPFDLMRRADIELTIASDKKEVTGKSNITFSNLTLLKKVDITEYDCLVLPGGPHYKFLAKSKEVHNIIKYFVENNKIIAAICAAPTILGQLGYLKGKRYTCFTDMNADFGGIHDNKPIVVDGNLITARSADAAIEFAYEIVRLVAGENVLENVWKHIYHEKQASN